MAKEAMKEKTPLLDKLFIEDLVELVTDNVLMETIVVFKDEIANQSVISGWYNSCCDGASGGLVRSRTFGEASLEVDLGTSG